METSGCPDGYFLDILTFTCLPCDTVCDPEYDTPLECTKNCPGYTYKVTTDAPSKSGLTIQTIMLPVLSTIITIVLVLVLAVVLVLLIRYRKTKYNRGYEYQDYLTDDRTTGTLLSTTSQNTTINDTHQTRQYGSCGQSNICCIHSSTSSQDPRYNQDADASTVPSTGQGNNCKESAEQREGVEHPNNQTGTSHDSSSSDSGRDTLYSMAPSHGSADMADGTLRDNDNDSGTDMNDCDNSEMDTNQFPTPTQVSDAFEHEEHTCSPTNQKYPFLFCGKMAEKGFEHTSNNFTGPSVLNGMVLNTKPKYISTQSMSEHAISPHSSYQAPLSLDLTSDNHHATDNLTDAAADDDAWSKVMELYETIEGKLAEFPWIVGCMISCNKLEVVMSTEKAKMTFEEALVKLQSAVSEELWCYLDVTAEGPDIELCCGTFGTGCEVHEVDGHNQRGKRTTVSLVGQTDGRSYLFTVGHILQDQRHSCIIKCNCGSNDSRFVRGHLEKYKDTLPGAIPTMHVQHKVFDMAIFKLESQQTQTNGRRIFNGTTPVAVAIDTANLSPYAIKNKPCLIFNQKQTHENINIDKLYQQVVRVSTESGQTRSKFQLNFMRLSSKGAPLSVCPGDSGSLVTYYPDNTGTVKAFAYVIGNCMGHKDQALALPLWDNMCQVCEGDPRLEQLVKCMDFSDFQLGDSAYISTV